MNNKTKHLIGFILNTICFLAGAFVITSFFVLDFIVEVDISTAHTLLFYFVVLSTLGSLIGSVSSLISFFTTKELNKTLSIIRSISLTALAFVTIFEIVSILMKSPSNLLSPLIFVLIATLLVNLISHLAFEPSYKQNALVGGLSAVFTLIYCVASFLFSNSISGWDMAPFQIIGTGIVPEIITGSVYILVSFVLGIVVCALKNINSKPYIVILDDVEIEPVVYNKTIVSFTSSEEIVEGPLDSGEIIKEKSQILIEEADEDSEEEEELKERKQAKADKKNNYQDRPRIYHISKHKNTGKWQVKLATGKKAIKLFDTQAKAVDFAKTLVETQGGSIRIHTLKGKIRKE